MIDPYQTDGTPEYVMGLFPKDFKGVCVDVGAFDPFWISNSWIFEQAGWDTYCIEPNPHCIPRLKQYRKNVLEYACSHKNSDEAELFIYAAQYAGPNLYRENNWTGEAGCTGLIDHSLVQQPTVAADHKKIFVESVKVKTRTLNWLMENEIKQDHIDYLSIDVERNELSVLVGTDLLKWKPKVIVIENLGREHGVDTKWDTIWKNPEEQDLLLKSKGYRHVHRISVNDIYMQQDYYYEFMFMDV